MTRVPSRPATGPRAGAAGLLAPVAEGLFGGELPVRIRAWDGSEAGPSDGPAVVLHSPQALRRLLWHPGELGLAQAYVTGELDVEGDLTDGLRAVRGPAQTGARAAPRSRGMAGGLQRIGHWGPARLPVAAWAAARAALVLGLPGPPPPAPASQAQVSGRRHSRARDQAVIAHHYDVPASFYELILDPSMAYSCADWSRATSGYTLAQAQEDKLAGICTRLALEPGSRLLDVGCGWGSLSLHAARHFGARVTAVTLAGEQAAYVRRRVTEAGLDDQVSVVASDYRDIPAGQHDAVTSIEMGEHVGAAQYPGFCARLAGQLRPGGRLLIQQMARPGRHSGGGKFIESYIAPDMHMRPAGQTVAMIEQAGLEVTGLRSMRVQYVRTIRAWLGHLESRADEITEILGPEGLRVWRLYLAGAALAFEEGRMSVHQLLAVRPS
jgi:cyclopropane-fatty-acyl-phospholipid synthase